MPFESIMYFQFNNRCVVNCLHYPHIDSLSLLLARKKKRKRTSERASGRRRRKKMYEMSQCKLCGWSNNVLFLARKRFKKRRKIYITAFAVCVYVAYFSENFRWSIFIRKKSSSVLFHFHSLCDSSSIRLCWSAPKRECFTKEYTQVNTVIYFEAL
jgi:hypothetical protein